MLFTKKHTNLSRRSIIKNTAMLALAAPAFRMIEGANAQASSPNRLICFFSGNGPMNASGPAEHNEDRFNGNFQLKSWWESLERHKDIGIFISNSAPSNAGYPKMVGHSAGGQTFDAWGADNYSIDGPSIHHVIEQQLRKENRAGVLGSVVWGMSEGSFARDPFSTAKGNDIRAETSPTAAWAQMFSNFMAPNPNAADQEKAVALMRRKASMLDFAISDCKKLQRALGAEGSRILDAQCTQLRSSELGILDAITRGEVDGPACDIPEQREANNYQQKMALFNEIQVAAFACELTHVIAFQTSASGGNNRVPGADSGHHQYTHYNNSDNKRNALETFTRAYCEQMADLLDKLKSKQDVNGIPLIETTAVLWKSELGGDEGSGNLHPESNIPEMWFGGGARYAHNKYIRGASPNTGKGGNFRAAGINAAQNLLAAMHHMGVKTNQVGNVTNIEPWEKLYK